VVLGLFRHAHVYPTEKNTLRKTTSANPGLPSSLPSLPALRQEISAARRALEAMEPKVQVKFGDKCGESN